ncbi:MAG TPA: response regulator transcription factor [Actinomycetota bacterium]|nr:response regulator transcription factor [Actinomycetota bacterium]
MKILLVDDHTLVRKGLIHLLGSVLSEAEVDEAEDADEALQKLRASKYDVALVDIRLPGRDGLQLLKEIRAEWDDVPVIILSSYDNGEYVKTALGDGAAGYLLKDTTPEDLIQAITVAMSGSGNVLSPRAVRNMFDVTTAAPSAREETSHQDAGLTKRESDVLQLLAKGCSNREISRQLFLSEKTVKAHLAAVFRKLGVTNRTQAAMVAVSKGLGGPVSAGAR